LFKRGPTAFSLSRKATGLLRSSEERQQRNRKIAWLGCIANPKVGAALPSMHNPSPQLQSIKKGETP
jgi:hypothetical protein